MQFEARELSLVGPSNDCAIYTAGENDFLLQVKRAAHDIVVVD